MWNQARLQIQECPEEVSRGGGVRVREASEARSLSLWEEQLRRPGTQGKC